MSWRQLHHFDSGSESRTCSSGKKCLPQESPKNDMTSTCNLPKTGKECNLQKHKVEQHTTPTIFFPQRLRFGCSCPVDAVQCWAVNSFIFSRQWAMMAASAEPHLTGDIGSDRRQQTVDSRHHYSDIMALTAAAPLFIRISFTCLSHVQNLSCNATCHLSHVQNLSCNTTCHLSHVENLSCNVTCYTQHHLSNCRRVALEGIQDCQRELAAIIGESCQAQHSLRTWAEHEW